MERPEIRPGVAEHAADVVVTNPQGLHLRPATEFARLAQASGCAIRLQIDVRSANGASVLELAMLAISVGSQLTIHATGDDCEQAVATLVALVERDFRPLTDGLGPAGTPTRG